MNVFPAIDNVPVRAAPVLAEAEYVKVPLPDPAAPDVIVSQLSCEAAVHAQPPPAVTVTVPLPPPAATLALPGAIANAHGAGAGGGGSGDGDGGVGVGGAGAGIGGGSADCAIVIAASPIVTLPVRAAPSFAATLTVIVPARVPVEFAGMLIHAASVAAVHEQPVSVSTAIETAPPFADTVVLAGVTVNRHGAASCSSSTSVLLTSIVARRCDGAGLAVIRYAIFPSPCPLLAAVSAIQSDAVVAAHVQSRAVDTVSVPSIPADGAVPDNEFETLTAHFGEVGAVSEIDDDALPHPSAIAESMHAANSRARIARVHTASALP